MRCNLCGADDAKFLFHAKNRYKGRKEAFRLEKCRVCGLVCLNPRPGKDEIKKYYPPAYWSRARTDVNVETTMIWGLPWPEAMKKKSRPILRHKKRGTILDIGCGEGSLLKFLRDLGWETYGVELGETASRFAREKLGLNVFSGRLEETSYPAEFFDAVTLFHVLEHLSDPLGALRKIYSLLKGDGILVIEVPNFGGFESLIFRSHWVGIAAPLHLYHFTAFSLSKMLKKCGFTPVELRFVSTKTKYIPGYSESIRYTLADWGLFSSHWEVAGEKKVNARERNSGWKFDFSGKGILHFLEYLLFSGLSYFTNRLELGSNLLVVAKKD